MPVQTRRTPLPCRLQVWSESRTAGSLRASGSLKVGTVSIFYQLHDLNKMSRRWSDAAVAAPVCYACSLCRHRLRSRTCRFHGPVPISRRVPPRSSRSLWVSRQERAVLISHPVTWSWTFRNMHPAESHPFALWDSAVEAKKKKMLLLAGSFNVIFPPPLVMTLNAQSFFHTSVLKAVWPTDDVVLWLCSNPLIYLHMKCFLKAWKPRWDCK